jgi:formate hydrogenlyase subunit 6/NADH:ubiquinone oxidoreductase subunit I
MLGLSRLINVAQMIPAALPPSPITVTQERCTRYRHRASTCSRCADVCPSAALSLSGNYPALDAACCTECGACASVCPTEAIEATGPSDEELSAKIFAEASEHGSVTLACKRAETLLPETVSVACLARLDLSMLLLAAAKGASQISLVTGACSECASGANLSYVCNMASTAETLTKALGVPTRISVQASVPASEPLSVEADVDLSRRSFFTKLGARSAGAKAATAPAAGTPSLSHDRSKDKDLSVHLPLKRIRFVESLRVLARLTSNRGTTILFSASKLDATKCIGCSMCADLCPTGALAAKEEGGMLRITCDASDCVACKLCIDVCRHRAVSLCPQDEGIVNSIRSVVFEKRINTDLLAPLEDKMSRMLGVSLYRT